MATAEELITENIDLWTGTIKRKSGVGRGKGSSKKIELYGVKKLRELILEMAVRGLLVPQDASDEPASVLLERIAAEKAELVKEKKIKKQKVLPAIEDSEVPFTLPKNWVWARLGNVCKKVTDGSHNPPPNAGSGYPMLSSQNVNFDRIDFSTPSRFVTEEDYHKENLRTNIRPFDVLLNIVASIGRSAVVPLEAPNFVLQRSVAVLDSALTPFYLSKMLVSPLCLRYYGVHAKGTAQKGIYLGKLSLMPLAIPPEQEQHRIVAKVDELMAHCDQLEQQTEANISAHQTLVETLLQAITRSDSSASSAESIELFFANFDSLFTTEESVDQLKQTILQLAVMGKLVPQDPSDEPASVLLKKIAAEKEKLVKEKKIKKQKALPPTGDEEKPFELPVGWEWCRFGTVTLTRLGKMLDKAKNKGEELPYLRNTNVQWHEFNLQDIKLMKISDEERDELLLIKGDLLICEGGEPGRCAIWSNESTEMYFQKALHRARPLGKILPEYLQINLTVDAANGVLENYFTGATIKHFVGTKLNSYLIPLAPLKEQHRITLKANELINLCDQLKAQLNTAQTTQLHLADAVTEQVIA